MQRHCDGTDPNLTKPTVSGLYRPCDCGNVFDDIDHSTIFPHGYIPAPEVRAKWIAEAAEITKPRAHKEVSTRRKAKSGIVHEMADLGVDYLCGRTAQEPYGWTEEPVTCRQCLSAASPVSQQEEK